MIEIDYTQYSVDRCYVLVYTSTRYECHQHYRTRYSICIQGASLRGQHTPPATLAPEGKIVWSGQRSMLDCKCKLATWKRQEPRRHSPGKQPTDATRMSIPRMYNMYLVTGIWYLVRSICDACLEACDYSELSFVARMTNLHGHTDWVCLTAVVLAWYQWVEKTQQ